MLLWDVLRVLVANKFLPLLLYSSPSPEGRDLMETFLLGLGVWSFLTRCVMSGCKSLFVPICCRRELVL